MTGRTRGGDGAGRKARPGPADAFALARRKWVAGERFDIGRMARELGVGRATLFRWVGSREQLYGEVVSALFATAVGAARRDARGRGAARVVDLVRRLLRTLVADPPLRRFVSGDPELALRVLMSARSPVSRRCTEVVRALLEEEERAGRVRSPMDLGSLAYVVVRIGEAFLYRDVLTGEEPDVEKAVVAIGVLVGAGRGARPSPRSAGRRSPASAASGREPAAR